MRLHLHFNLRGKTINTKKYVRFDQLDHALTTVKCAASNG